MFLGRLLFAVIFGPVDKETRNEALFLRDHMGDESPDFVRTLAGGNPYNIEELWSQVRDQARVDILDEFLK